MTDALRNLELLEEKATAVFNSADQDSTKRLRLAAIHRAIQDAEAQLRETAAAAGMPDSLTVSEIRRQAPTWRRREPVEDDEGNWGRQSLGRRRSDYVKRPKSA